MPWDGGTLESRRRKRTSRLNGMDRWIVKERVVRSHFAVDFDQVRQRRLLP